MRTLLVRLLVCVSCLGEGQGLLGAEGAATGLYYNRFRYYDPQAGQYLSQDPIGLEGRNPTLYGYVKDPNKQIDFFGLAVKVGQVGRYGDLVDASSPNDYLDIHHIPQDKLGHLPKRDGIAVVMPNNEHKKTRTYKGRGKKTNISDKNRAFKDVLKDDLVDLRKIGGKKYDSSIKKIIQEYEAKGFLKPGELTLKDVKKACLIQ